jgi:hypothetical protein
MKEKAGARWRGRLCVTVLRVLLTVGLKRVVVIRGLEFVVKRRRAGDLHR